MRKLFILLLTFSSIKIAALEHEKSTVGLVLGLSLISQKIGQKNSTFFDSRVTSATELSVGYRIENFTPFFSFKRYPYSSISEKTSSSINIEQFSLGTKYNYSVTVIDLLNFNELRLQPSLALNYIKGSASAEDLNFSDIKISQNKDGIGLEPSLSIGVSNERLFIFYQLGISFKKLAFDKLKFETSNSLTNALGIQYEI